MNLQWGTRRGTLAWSREKSHEIRLCEEAWACFRKKNRNALKLFICDRTGRTRSSELQRKRFTTKLQDTFNDGPWWRHDVTVRAIQPARWEFDWSRMSLVSLKPCFMKTLLKISNFEVSVMKTPNSSMLAFLSSCHHVTLSGIHGHLCCLTFTDPLCSSCATCISKILRGNNP